jgi:hypothetical protein
MIENENSILPQMLFTLFSVITYLLASATTLSFAAWKQEGWGNVKSSEEQGVIFELQVGLVIGAVFGVVGEIIAGVAFEQGHELAKWVSYGLFFGLLNALINGLRHEFE